ncbi:MAG: HPr family phosphocarrier protein [Clostridiaceae bacterium]
MVEKQVEIMNETGLHARPAAMFAKAAGKFKSSVTVVCDGRKANAKSILGIISLGAAKGKIVTITTEGEDEAEAATTLVQLMMDFKE